MKTEEMSVHRALAELKNIDSRIKNEISRAVFAGGKRKISETIQNVTSDVFKSRSKSYLQTITDLSNRRNAIKSALVLSNANTKVNIAGNEMTVAEAIDKKNTVDIQKTLIQKLKATHAGVHLKVTQFNETLSEEALAYFKQITENKDKLNENAFKAVLGAYKEEREQEIIEGFDVYKTYTDMEDELENFLTNVDYILSESNTETKITIEY